jgi:hypothetical protein
VACASIAGAEFPEIEGWSPETAVTSYDSDSLWEFIRNLKESVTPSNGKMTKESFGYSGPANAPMFQKPPIYFRGVESMTVLYETDEKAAQALVPDGLEIPLPATVNMTVFSAPFTTVGPYNSAIVRIHCLWQ